jgi:hypothetical protein
MSYTYEYIKKFLNDGVNGSYEYVINNVNKQLTDRTIYEFGVYKGRSLPIFFDKIACSSVVGFDSFEGLPIEAKDKHTHVGWVKGLYSASTDLQEVPKKIASNIEKSLRKELKSNDVYIQQCWFTDIVFNASYMKKAIFVNVDCDIYSSTCEMFEFLFKNDLIDENTFFRFDDWGGTPEFVGGESKAFVEKCAKYNYGFEILYKKYSGVQDCESVAKIHKLQHTTYKTHCNI